MRSHNEYSYRLIRKEKSNERGAGKNSVYEAVSEKCKFITTNKNKETRMKNFVSMCNKINKTSGRNYTLMRKTKRLTYIITSVACKSNFRRGREYFLPFNFTSHNDSFFR